MAVRLRDQRPRRSWTSTPTTIRREGRRWSSVATRMTGPRFRTGVRSSAARLDGSSEERAPPVSGRCRCGRLRRRATGHRHLARSALQLVPHQSLTDGVRQPGSAHHVHRQASGDTQDEAGIIALLRLPIWASRGSSNSNRSGISRTAGASAPYLNGLEEESRPGQELRFLPDDLVRLHHMSAEGPVPSTRSTSLRERSRGSACSAPCSIRYAEGRRSWWTSSMAVCIRTSCNSSSSFSRAGNPTPVCQLVFNAHDPTVLGDSSQRSLGRDQIWLTEKSADGGTSLYSTQSSSRSAMKPSVGATSRTLRRRPMLNPAEFERAAT